MKQKRTVYGGHGALELLKIERKKFKDAIDALAILLQGMSVQSADTYAVPAEKVNQARAALALGMSP